MKRLFLMAVLLSAIAICPVAHADDIVIISMLPTPTPPPAATATPRPELPEYGYPDEDARCLERMIWSVCPAHPTDETRLAACEVVQNMVDDGRYRDSIRYTLLMDSEFPSYDPDAYRSEKNASVADYAMRSWRHATETGDRSYRLTPSKGVRFSFYRAGGKDFITVYDWDWNTVYDSGNPQG